MSPRNTPDWWDCAYETCAICNTTYHKSEYCSCCVCEICKKQTSPDDMHDDFVCSDCNQKIEDGEIPSLLTKRQTEKIMNQFDSIISKLFESGGRR